ncbi:fumonisin cluster-fatty acyl-CoA Synthase [Fusarium proliferatum ET1]|uniref:Fumonisin cluster-fatty acyl-CoA Synthase n=1 Tax=Fusarium proliferatum (strain ET1) TaxID=1227346 RepID=A0A1L7W6C2_FUSPR|nr:fumonisin cluster-fatty acyl-CoA Synthase [Fusarium proliferatum ET1]CZR47921.1 fumonisin cluster-fatty acyl-CoA Synthase [Fusarium proliferatum ET1]
MDTLTHVLLLPEALETLGSPSVIIPRASSTSDEVVSYAHLTDLVQSLQQDLAALGISAGNKLALVLPNGLQYVAILLAAIRQRAISAPIHPNSTREECKQIFSLMVPDLVVVISSGSSTNGLQSAQAAVLAAQDLSLLVASCHAYPQSGRLSFRFALSRVAYEAGASKYPAPCAEYSRDDVMAEDKVLMLFTSGTTGRPKSVQLTHTNLLVAMRIIIAAHRLTSRDRSLLITPLFHIIGIAGSLLPTLFTGGCAVIPASLPASFWQDCHDYSITWYHAVPTLHQLLLSFPLPKDGVPTTLRFIRSGGSDMSPYLFNRLQKLGVPLLEVYGMTETAPAIFCNPFPVTGTSITILRQPGQYPIPDAVDVMILPPERASSSEPNGELDEPKDKDPVSRLTKELGVRGEICLRGKNIMAGYTNNPTANAEAFLPNGFFRTGDLGVILPRQYLALIGRVKEIINKGGEKISPAEIEHVARLHDEVKDAACFRIKEEIYGEIIGT